MIIAAVCLGKFVPSGQPINVPFGKGNDHGEAYATLLRFYNILESRADGFAASVGDEIVFMNREDAMKHALENDQVKPDCRRHTRLNSEMLNSWERGEAYDRLTDMDYRMRDFYWLAKAKYNIANDYRRLPALSQSERESILNNVAETCGFPGVCY